MTHRMGKNAQLLNNVIERVKAGEHVLIVSPTLERKLQWINKITSEFPIFFTGDDGTIFIPDMGKVSFWTPPTDDTVLTRDEATDIPDDVYKSLLRRLRIE